MPYGRLPAEIAARLKAHGLKMVLFDLLNSLGYLGWSGCEYRPRGNTWKELSWAARYGIRASKVLPAK